MNIDPVPQLFLDQAERARIARIASSFRRITGRVLVPEGEPVVEALWQAPRVILAHDTKADPIFFFGNRQALDLFEIDADALVRMPSRLSAEPLLREERQALLQRVADCGFIDDYAGVRISARGRRFRIEKAIVWDLIDEQGIRHGQAATFDHWTCL